MLPIDYELPQDVSEQTRETFYYRLIQTGIVKPILCYTTDDYILDLAWPDIGLAVVLQQFNPQLHNKLTLDGWKVLYFPGREMFKAESYAVVASIVPKLK